MAQTDLSKLINAALVDRFVMTSHMYANAQAQDEAAHKRQREQDWAEWRALDEESKAFVRAQLESEGGGHLFR